MPLLLWKWLEPTGHDVLSVFHVSGIVPGVTGGSTVQSDSTANAKFADNINAAVCE